MMGYLHSFLQKEAFLDEKGKFQHLFVVGRANNVMLISHGRPEEGYRLGVIDKAISQSSEYFLVGMGIADVAFAGNVTGIIGCRWESRRMAGLNHFCPPPVEIAVMSEVEEV
jgi:hypothetical protein